MRTPSTPCTRSSLPVTLAAAEVKDWVVVPYQDRGVAMTILEAYERGLREAPCWLPDLTGVSTVPAIGEIADHLSRN